MTSPLAVAFITLGCPKNEVDSDRMAAAVLSSAYHLVEEIDEADVVVLNTCGFISDAVEESIDVAFELATWRDAREGRRLVVAGCMVSRYGDDLATAMPEADAFVPVAGEAGLLAVLDTLTGQRHAHAEAGASRTVSGPSAYLQVSDGCFRTCAYCTIPAIRGPYRSRTLDEIEAEARFLVEFGAVEIVLIGQDTSAWGRDLAGDETIADVLRAVAAVPDVLWVRLMYVQPDGITDELLRTMAALPQVLPYLDMPLQHVSRDVLRAMHRTGSPTEFRLLITRIRDVMPGAVLRSTFIAGYPGETVDDHDELLGFLADADIDYAGVFPYSPEEGTAALALPGQLPFEERVARANRVREAADQAGFQRAASLVGTSLDILAEGVDDEGVTLGRWWGQAPEIDGLVALDLPTSPGTVVCARIVEAYGYDLEGEICP